MIKLILARWEQLMLSLKPRIPVGYPSMEVDAWPAATAEVKFQVFRWKVTTTLYGGYEQVFHIPLWVRRAYVSYKNSDGSYTASISM